MHVQPREPWPEAERDVSMKLAARSSVLEHVARALTYPTARSQSVLYTFNGDSGIWGTPVAQRGVSSPRGGRRRHSQPKK